MGDLFLKVLEMSVTGSVVILITMLTRFLLRKRSKRLIMILWAVVAIRLMVPVSIESSLSLFNYLPIKTQNLITTAQVEETSVPDYDVTANEAALVVQNGIANDASLTNSVTEHESKDLAGVKALPDIKTVIAVIWITGTVGIISYCSVRYIMLKRKLKDAREIEKNIYESDKVNSPFVFGFFVPKMYLPDDLGNTEREYVLMHERTHIRHGDWISKIIGMAILAVHWFNPLVWIGYALFEQDIEMSCDETTVSNLNANMRKAYAMSLVAYAKKSNNKRYLVTPLGFSKNTFSKTEVTNRIMNIVNFKKGSKITTVAIAAALLVLGAACGLNSKPSENETAADSSVTSAEMTAEVTSGETEDSIPEALKGLPKLNGKEITLPCSLEDLETLGYEYDGGFTSTGFGMRFADGDTEDNSIYCHITGTISGDEDGITGDFEVFVIQIRNESVFDYYGVRLGMTEDELLAAMGDPSDMASINGGESGNIYYYELENGNVLIFPFMKYEDETSDSVLDVIFYAADEIMVEIDGSDVVNRSPG